MASARVPNVFLKCRKCEAINRLVTVGVPDHETVSCSQCGEPIGEWSKLKLMASSHEAGRDALPGAWPSGALAARRRRKDADPRCFPDHLTALAKPPQQVADLLRDGGPTLRVGRIPALLTHDAVGQLGRVHPCRGAAEMVEDGAL